MPGQFVADNLVADDAPAKLQILSGTLGVRGYRVRPAQSGQLALQAAKAKPSRADAPVIPLSLLLPSLLFLTCDAGGLLVVEDAGVCDAAADAGADAPCPDG